MSVEIVQENFWNKDYENVFESWLQSLSVKENEAIYMYMYHWHKNMNNSLRDNTPNELAINLSKALNVAPKMDGVLFRGSSRIPNLKIGDTFVGDTFLSTSLNPHIAAKFMKQDKVFYKIETKTGGVLLNSDMNEEEVLLNHGHEFTVTNIISDTSLKIFYPDTEYCVVHENITFIHLKQ